MSTTLRSSPPSHRSAHLRADDLRIVRHGRVLIEGVSCTVPAGRRLAVVGENGRGKTTLLETLAGLREPDAGVVERHGSLALVRQTLPVLTADARRRTVGDLTAQLLSRPRAALGELDAAALALAEDASAAAAARYDDALAAATRLEAWDAPRRLEAALEELGAVHPPQRRLGELSVGQRYRIRLAGVLAAREDLLLLDEPGNHLDDRGLDHLARVLREHDGAAVLVSHDRTLLAEVATAFLDLDPTAAGVPLLVGGGIETWRAERLRARAAWEDAYARQQGEQRRLAEQAQRARDRLMTGWRPEKGTGRHQRASRAPGVVRAMNERMARLEEHRLDVPPPPPRLVLAPSGTRAGVPVLRADGAGVRGDGPRPRLRGLDLRLAGGDRLLLVGPNGAGKSTALGLLSGRIAPDEGEVRVLGGARIGELRQEHGPQGASHRVPEDASRDRPGSPGERRRRELARLFAERADVLLLDEPTNHLGPAGVDDLVAALAGHPAAVVLATHDRHLLEVLSAWPRRQVTEGELGRTSSPPGPRG